MVNATLRPLYPGNDLVPIVKGAGWAPGPVCRGVENLALIRTRSPECQARSESYRLGYHGPQITNVLVYNEIHSYVLYVIFTYLCLNVMVFIVKRTVKLLNSACK